MEQNQFTLLLQDWSKGDKAALDALTPVVYSELRKLAAAKLGRESDAHTLQPTALIHEAYLRLVGHQQQMWHSRAHFFAVASHIMREILVDPRPQALGPPSAVGRRWSWTKRSPSLLSAAGW